MYLLEMRSSAASTSGVVSSLYSASKTWTKYDGFVSCVMPCSEERAMHSINALIIIINEGDAQGLSGE